MAETESSSSEQVIVQVGATEEDEEEKFKTEHSSADEEAIGDENSNNETVKTEISFKSLLYGAHSYYAVVKPVILTMILTALSITYVTTEKSLKEVPHHHCCHNHWRRQRQVYIFPYSVDLLNAE